MRALLAIALLVGCGGDLLPRDATIDTKQPLALCSPCTDDLECATGICRQYGDGYRKCTAMCEPSQPALVCPQPASTGGCNEMGYCMCPFLPPPTDAGVDDADAGYKDAMIFVPEDAPSDAS